MSPTKKSETTIPLVEERLRVDKVASETGRVRIRTVVDEQLARVSEELERDDVSIERVPINQEVSAAPQIREDGDVLIVPLLEEVVVVEKRLVLREELHIRRNRKHERVEEAVRVRRMRAEVDRVPASAKDGSSATERSTTAPRLRRKEPVQETAGANSALIRRRPRLPR